MNVQGITPNTTAPLQAQAVSSPRAAGTSGSSGTSATGTSGSSTDLQATFLSLLVTELQNQDPTSPVDPTQMVGQMISLNQLDQLIAMNQTLTNITGGTSSAASSSSSNSNANVASAAGTGTSTSAAAARTAGASTSVPSQSPATTVIDPNAMMNLYGSAAAQGTVAH